MRPSRPCLRVLCPPLAWLLGLVLLTGLAACGPAPSDQALNVEPRAAVGGPSESPSVLPHSSSPRTDSATPAASPAPLAAPMGLNHAPTPEVKDEPAPLPAQLVLPQWIAQALASPKVSVRLQALDLWGQQGPEAPLDPLVVALDDADEDVRTKAMAIVERHWAVKQEPEAEK